MAKVYCVKKECKHNKNGVCQRKEINLRTISGSYDERDLFCLNYKQHKAKF